MLRKRTTILGTLFAAAIVGTTGSAVGQEDCPDPDPTELQPAPLRNDVWRHFFASSCWVETDYIEDYIVDVAGLTNVSGDPGARRRDIYCPIIEDELVSNESGSEFTQVTLNGFDGSEHDTVLATVCVAHPTSMMTDCGADVISGRNEGFGTKPLGPIPPCWLIDEWGFDLNLDLPPHQSGFYSFVAVSLPPHGRAWVTGYSVSRCENPENCTTPYCYAECPDVP